jgi:hypothetical protein
VDLEHNIGFITLLYLPCTDTAEEKSLCSEDNEGGRSCKSNASLNSTNSETEISNDNSAFEDEVDFNDWSLYDLQVSNNSGYCHVATESIFLFICMFSLAFRFLNAALTKLS